jgi:hypothetical protein
MAIFKELVFATILLRLEYKLAGVVVNTDVRFALCVALIGEG